MKNIGIDKWIHAVLSMVVVAVVALVMKGTEDVLTNAQCAAMGVAVALCCGIAKEVFDKFVRETGFSWGDIAADAVGAAVGFGFALMM